MTVKELFEKFDVYMNSRLKPNTYRGYKVNINNHILPYIADLCITDITCDTIDVLFRQLKNKGLNNTSVRYCFAVFRKALNYGVKRGYIDTNIMLSYDFPKANSYFYNVLSESQLKRLCSYLENDDIYPAVMLAAFYGLRKGEVLGLRLCDLDWCEDTQQYTVHIRRSVTDLSSGREVSTPKNKSSVRDIVLSEKHSERLLRFVCLRTIEPNDYLCTSGFGQYITTNRLCYRFKRALDFLKLPSVRFHDLRHSYATLMLKHGVHPKIVSSVLGHSDISTTLDIYSHVDLSVQKACLDVIDSI